MSKQLQQSLEALSPTTPITVSMENVLDDFDQLAAFAEAEQLPHDRKDLKYYDTLQKRAKNFTVHCIEWFPFHSQRGPIGTVVSTYAQPGEDCGVRHFMLMSASYIELLPENEIETLTTSLVAEFEEQPRRLHAILVYGDCQRVIYYKDNFALPEPS